MGIGIVLGGALFRPLGSIRAFIALFRPLGSIRAFIALLPTAIRALATPMCSCPNGHLRAYGYACRPGVALSLPRAVFCHPFRVHIVLSFKYPGLRRAYPGLCSVTLSGCTMSCRSYFPGDVDNIALKSSGIPPFKRQNKPIERHHRQPLYRRWVVAIYRRKQSRSPRLDLKRSRAIDRHIGGYIAPDRFFVQVVAKDEFCDVLGAFLDAVAPHT